MLVLMRKRQLAELMLKMSKPQKLDVLRADMAVERALREQLRGEL